MNKIDELLSSPTKQAERRTILNMEVPEFKKPVDGESYGKVNSERNKIVHKQAGARQEQKVYDKRHALGVLADMIKQFKKSTEEQAGTIRKYAIDNDLDDMLDFCPWEDYSIDPILESDPIEAALKWMSSDHSC